MDVLTYRSFGSAEYAGKYIGYKDYVVSYLLTYKLPEDLFITPSSSKQFFEPSAKNRYIRSITVEPVTTTTTTPTA